MSEAATNMESIEREEPATAYEEEATVDWAPVEETFFEHCVRRTWDIAISIGVLTLISPVLLTVAALIKLDSPGPAFFLQTRLTGNRRRGQSDRRRRNDPRLGSNRRSGKDRREQDILGRPFTIVKFRTMVTDNVEKFPELTARNFSEEDIKHVTFKWKNDPRITKFGAFLRKTSLDEFPNFWNVIKGDMTLVGPRPEVLEMTRYYTAEQRRKFSVPSGLTGLAQVEGRGTLKFQDTVSLDLDYVRKRSLWVDMKLLWKTVVVVFKAQGAV